MLLSVVVFISQLFLITYLSLTDGGVMKLLKNQRKLKYLRMEKLPLLKGEFLTDLQSGLLRTLVLKNLQQFQELYFIDALSHCPSLCVLDLQHCYSISDSAILAASAILKQNLVSSFLKLFERINILTSHRI